MNYGYDPGYTNGYYEYGYAYAGNESVEEVDPYADEYVRNSEEPNPSGSGEGWVEEPAANWDGIDRFNSSHHDLFLDQVSHSRSQPNRGRKRRDITIQPDKIPVPSPSYLRVTEEPSVRLTDPTQNRKLLILDLNGTLLYRESRPPLRDNRDPYSIPEPRPLRRTHTRPYIPSFKAFLFHPDTRRWLDTMVWSSAQYPNVKDMVGRCFGEDQVAEYMEQSDATQKSAKGMEGSRDGLVAIWDRAFLGLNETQYRNKTQTTKNLAKPWDLLPLSPFSGPAKALSQAWDRATVESAEVPDSSILGPTDDESNSASVLASLAEACNLTWNDSLAHSAKSTLLLDDSPLKARMQPYNHICVPEYERRLHARDVRIVEARNRNSSSSFPTFLEETVDSPPSDDAENGKRKRSGSPLSSISLPRKKKMKGPSYSDAKPLLQHHDHVLLAVIGLLDALKHESNVAGWVKGQGLFAGEHIELGDVDSSLSEGDAETRQVFEQRDEELDKIYRESVPDGVEDVTHSGGKKKKPRHRGNRNSSFFGKSLTDAGSGNDIGVAIDTFAGDDEDELSSRPLSPQPPTQSQTTEPASRPESPDSQDLMNYSGTTTLPASPPSAGHRRELARKIHLMPRQEHRNARSQPQPRPSTPIVVDSALLYGPDADVSNQSGPVPPSDLNVVEGENKTGSSGGERDIFSDPPTSPPGLNGEVSGFDLNDSSNSLKAQMPRSPVDDLPSLWYQHSPARWYWVRRGVSALKELGLEVIPGVRVD